MDKFDSIYLEYDFSCLYEEKEYYENEIIFNIIQISDFLEHNAEPPLDLYFSMAQYNIKLSNYEEAIDNLNSVIKKASSNYEYYFERGKLYVLCKMYEYAINDFYNASLLDFDNPLYYFYMGSCSYELKKYCNAVNQYNIAIELDDKNELYYYYLGNCFFKILDYDNAIKSFDKAIKLNSNCIHYYINRGQAYFSIKDYQQSLVEFNKAIEINDMISQFYIYRGYCYIYLNKFDLAIKDLKKNIDLNGDQYNKTPPMFYYINSNCQNKEIEVKLEKILYSLYFRVEILKNCLTSNDCSKISQYTNIYNIEKTFNPDDDKLKFRVFNNIYMNDPQEGKTFNNAISNSKDLKNFIDLMYPQNKYFKQSNTYLISFSKNPEETLPMWVHYGNKTNGAKIEIKTDNFDKSSYVKAINFYNDKENIDWCLHNVIYDINKYKYDINEIRKNLRQIYRQLKKLDEKQKKFILSVTRDLLDQVRFLFKDKIFEYEEEVRVVVFENNKEKIKLTDTDPTSKVPKLYIELDKEIPYNEVTVTLGSNVAKPNEVAQYLYHVGVKEVKMSEIEYN